MAQVNLYLGAMNSGKTTQMLMAYHSYIENGKHPLIIKPCVDTRDGNIPENTFGKITSRVFQDGDVSALYINEFDKDFIFDLINEYHYDAVFCDEIQFFSFEAILGLTDIADELNIPVNMYGLKTDINGNLFTGTQKAIALASNLFEIPSICKCGEKATLHIRLTNGKPNIIGAESIVVDDKAEIQYLSVCRKCWKKMVKAG